MRLGLSRVEENRVLEGLVVLLFKRAKGARNSVPPGGMGNKVAGTCAHLVNVAAYKLGKASEGVRSKAGTVKV